MWFGAGGVIYCFPMMVRSLCGISYLKKLDWPRFYLPSLRQESPTCGSQHHYWAVASWPLSHGTGWPVHKHVCLHSSPLSLVLWLHDRNRAPRSLNRAPRGKNGTLWGKNGAPQSKNGASQGENGAGLMSVMWALAPPHLHRMHARSPVCAHVPTESANRERLGTSALRI